MWMCTRASVFDVPTPRTRKHGVFQTRRIRPRGRSLADPSSARKERAFAVECVCAWVGGWVGGGWSRVISVRVRNERVLMRRKKTYVFKVRLGMFALWSPDTLILRKTSSVSGNQCICHISRTHLHARATHARARTHTTNTGSREWKSTKRRAHTATRTNTPTVTHTQSVAHTNSSPKLYKVML
jgi:hypothetical protein